MSSDKSNGSPAPRGAAQYLELADRLRHNNERDNKLE